MRSFLEVFKTNTLVPKELIEINEDLLIGGYKSLKELRKTEPEIFFDGYVRLSKVGEVNGTRFCFAASLKGKMEQHPYTQWVYWLPIRLVYFNRDEYKSSKTIKWLNIPLNILLWRGEDEETRFGHFLKENVSSMGDKNLLEASIQVERGRLKEKISECIGADIETIRKAFS
jgi:hypothetical protein